MEARLLGDLPGGGGGPTSYGGNADMETRVYARRFWVLFLLSMAAMQQGAVWGTYTVMSSYVYQIYPSWTGNDLKLFAAWGPIIYIPMAMICPWLVRKMGLRACITLAAGLSFACCVLRILTTSSPYALILAHAAQIFNAAAGPLVLGTPSKLSALWFPPHQRTTATAVSNMANYLGSAVSFALGLLVHSSADAMWLLRGYAIFTGAVFVMCLFDHCFPAVPAIPPSVTANASEEKQINILQCYKMLLLDANFMLICAIYAISNGFYSGWTGILNLVVEPLLSGSEQHRQDIANWIGTASSLASITAGLVMGPIADRIGRVKWVLFFTQLVAGASFAWFVLITSGVEKDTHAWMLFVSVCLGGGFLSGTSPLFYETSVESTFPLPEVASVSLITLVFNIMSGTLILLGEVLSPLTMNILLPASCGVCALLLLVYRERLKRATIDHSAEEHLWNKESINQSPH